MLTNLLAFVPGAAGLVDAAGVSGDVGLLTASLLRTLAGLCLFVVVILIGVGRLAAVVRVNLSERALGGLAPLVAVVVLAIVGPDGGWSPMGVLLLIGNGLLVGYLAARLYAPIQVWLDERAKRLLPPPAAGE